MKDKKKTLKKRIVRITREELDKIFVSGSAKVLFVDDILAENKNIQIESLDLAWKEYQKMLKKRNK